MKKIILSSLIALSLGTATLLADKTSQPEPINPFEEIQKLQQEMDQVFNRFHQKFLNDATFAKFQDPFANTPPTDLKDTGDKYIIKADIPGADKNNIKVTQKNGTLKIEAQTIKEKKEKGETYLRQERFEGSFVKILTLPKDADADKLKTNYQNGVLTITIPKKEQ